MNKKQILAILMVLIYIVVSSVSATPTISGGLPVNSTPVNMSAYVSLVNESYATITYVNAADATSGIWNTSYYLRDTSRSLTGANIYRNVNNDLLYLWGGDTGNPQGGQIQLYGGANPGLDGGMAFAVGDAAGNFHPVMWIEGTTDTPHLTMISHQIKELLDPTAAQDAATMHYVDDAVAGGTTAQLNDYFKNDTSKLLYGSDLKRDVDNSYLAMYGGNAIAGGTGIIVAYGKNHPGTNEAEIIVGDAAGTGNIVVSGWRGGAAPLLDMNSYNITGIKTITNATDAVNKSWSENLVWNNASLSSLTLDSNFTVRPAYLSVYGGNGTTDLAHYQNLIRVTNFGYQAGWNNTQQRQTAIGYQAGWNNTAIYQTAIGDQAGYNNSEIYQTAIGSASGYNNTGKMQTAIGSGSGYKNTGIYQTATGYASGYLNTGQNQSTHGYFSGYQNTGNDTIFIGYEAGKSNTLDNQFIVKQSSISANPLLVGNLRYGNISSLQSIVGTDLVNKSYTDSLTANLSSGGSGGQIIYFNHSVSPDVAGFETLNLIPSGNVEADESVVVNSGLGEVIVDPYVTSLLYPAITSIPPGLWRFRTFHYVSNSGGNTNAVFKVYKRSAGGAETLLFTVVSEDINANTVQEYLTSYAQASAIPLLTTDRLEIKVYGQSTSVSDKTFHFVYDGSIHTSHVLTPISVLSSLDNYAYLPGRSGGQVLTGGTGANDDLVLNGTSSATKTSSYVILQPSGGQVIVGGDTPTVSQLLFVYGSSGSSGSNTFVYAGSGNNYVRIGEGNPGKIESYRGLNMAVGFASGGYRAMTIDGNGRISVGITAVTPSANFSVENLFFVNTTGGNVTIGQDSKLATAQFDTTGTVRFRNFGAGTATFDAGGNITSVSDEKYKTNIVPFTSGLAAILKTNPINYKFNQESGLDTQNVYTGFSAQQLKTAIPEAVFEKPDITYEQVLTKPEVLDGKSGEVTEEAEYTTVEKPVLDKDGKQTTTLSISDRAIIAAQINAIKELNAKIEAQNETINKQEARIAALEKKVGIVKP